VSQVEWDRRFLELVIKIASWSKDTSTKVGCAIVDDHNRVISLGFNGIPTGVDDTIPSRSQRPEKYQWYEHAERNAIYNSPAGRSLRGCTLYCTHFPCPDCARGIVQVGIKTVKLSFYTQPFSVNKHYNNGILNVLKMFDEVGISIYVISNGFNYKVRKNEVRDSDFFYSLVAS